MAASLGVSAVAVSLLLVWWLGVDPGSILSAGPSAMAAEASPIERLEALARRDPVAFFDHCLERYEREIRNYQLVMVKQELLPAGMTAEQKLEVVFQEKPFSVVMNYLENAERAQKILFASEDDSEHVWILPANPLLRVFTVKRALNSDEVKAGSRKGINQFGFANSLRMFQDVTRRAQAAGDLLQLSYSGQREVNGRPTFLFERRLNNPDNRYPDTRTYFHVDQEWLIPTSAQSEDGEGNLLGRYIFTDVKFNLELPKDTFTRKGQGM